MQESQGQAQISKIHASKVVCYLTFIQEGRSFSEFFSTVDLFKRKGEMEHAKKVQLMIADSTYSVYKHSHDIRWLITTAHKCLEEDALMSASAMAQYVYTEICSKSMQNETLLKAAHIAGYAFFKAGNEYNAQKWLQIELLRWISNN